MELPSGLVMTNRFPCGMPFKGYFPAYAPQLFLALTYPHAVFDQFFVSLATMALNLADAGFLRIAVTAALIASISATDRS